MRLIPLARASQVSAWAANHIITRINSFNPTPENPFVLGLPTGSTPLETYKLLIEANKAGVVNFENVVIFNMDEYIGLPEDHPETYRAFMHKHLLDHINVKPENINLLNGNVEDFNAECERYELKIKEYGKIHLFMGGVGLNGHIAFNEPCSSLTSRTRIKTLTSGARVANAKFFDGDASQVPTHALTVGVGTLMDSEEVLILATGENKALAISAAIEGGVNHSWTISALQMHRKAIIVCDEPAQQELKVKTLKYFSDIEAKSIKAFTDK